LAVIPRWFSNNYAALQEANALFLLFLLLLLLLFCPSLILSLLPIKATDVVKTNKELINY
jgi:hypothetical protein